ncbi:MAG: DOMON-like domain-containing protein [Steroidobacteraceae bacterium]
MEQGTELVCHPATHCDAVRRIVASIAREAAGAVRLGFHIEGDIAKLRLPEASDALRSDGLWQHCCFEAFLKADGDAGYHEFNFAPSGSWAAYRFDAPREGRESPDLAAPRIAFRRRAGACDMTVDLALAALPELARAQVIHAGLSAVIEDSRGMLSYWALAHGAAQPDFHDPATFVMRMGAR